MSANVRRRVENKLPVAVCFAYLLLILLVLGVGMSWVYYKNQLFHCGEAIRAMDQEKAALVEKNAELEGLIKQLSTLAVLQKSCEDGVIQMVKIAPEHVVALDLSRPADTRVAAAAAGTPGRPAPGVAAVGLAAGLVRNISTQPGGRR